MNRIHNYNDGRTAPIEYKACSAITPKVGLLLKISGGNLALATGADKPTYFCMREQDEACAAGDIIPVVRIAEDMVFETDTPVTFTQAVGAAVKIGTDGMSITNTAGGACEITYTDGEVTRYRVVDSAAT